jgi:hypothetical protein
METGLHVQHNSDDNTVRRKIVRIFFAAVWQFGSLAVWAITKLPNHAVWVQSKLTKKHQNSLQFGSSEN